MMEKMIWKKFMRQLKVLPALLLMSVIVMAASIDTLAAGMVDVGRDGHLSVEYVYDEKPLAEAEFSLYRVGDLSTYGRYSLSGEFADCPVNLEGLDSTGWKDAAGTLAIYADADKIRPIDTQRTDSLGHADFGTQHTGLFLLRAKEIWVDNTAYRSEPFLVSLPSLDKDDLWVYDVTARPKIINTVPSWNGELTVIKVWNDGRYRESRPQQIEVTLLKDGAAYEKVTLSSLNNWRYTWSGLSGFSTWNVVEGNIEGGYTVTYTKEGAVYTVTNTITGNTPGGGDSGGGGGNRTGKSYEPPIVELPDTEVPEAYLEIPGEPIPQAKLPQTGLLWWPVPFLAMAGLLMFGFGYKDYFGRKRKTDEK